MINSAHVSYANCYECARVRSLAQGLIPTSYGFTGSLGSSIPAPKVLAGNVRLQSACGEHSTNLVQMEQLFLLLVASSNIQDVRLPQLSLARHLPHNVS